MPKMVTLRNAAKAGPKMSRQNSGPHAATIIYFYLFVPGGQTPEWAVAVRLRALIRTNVEACDLTASARSPTVVKDYFLKSLFEWPQLN